MRNSTFTFTFILATCLLGIFYSGSVPYLRLTMDSNPGSLGGLVLVIVEIIIVFMIFASSVIRQKYVAFFAWVFIVALVLDIVLSYLGITPSKAHGTTDALTATFRYPDREWLYSLASMVLAVFLIGYSAYRAKRA